MSKIMPARRNVWLLCVLAFLQGLVFYSPIATLYRKASGLTMLDIALIESISLILSLLLEMPWGVVADRIGYKRTMVVCSVLFFLSKVVFWQADSFGAFLAERVLLAVVISGMSGVDSALLYLSCPPETQQRTFAIYGSAGTAGLLAASMLYSLCFGGSYRLAGFWTMAAYGAAMVVSFFLTEPAHAAQTQEKPEPLIGVVVSVIRRPQLLLLLLAFALFQETRQAVTVFLNQLQYQRSGIPGGAFGVLLAAMQLVGLLGVFSQTLTDRIGERRTLLFLLALSAAACAVLSATASPVLSVLCVALLALSGSLLSPLQSVVENRQVRTSARATELSVYAMAADGVSAGANVLFGRAADVSLPLAFQVGAIACVLAFGIYFALTAKRATNGAA